MKTPNQRHAIAAGVAFFILVGFWCPYSDTYTVSTVTRTPSQALRHVLNIRNEPPDPTTERISFGLAPIWEFAEHDTVNLGKLVMYALFAAVIGLPARWVGRRK